MHQPARKIAARETASRIGSVLLAIALGLLAIPTLGAEKKAGAGHPATTHAGTIQGIQQRIEQLTQQRCTRLEPAANLKGCHLAERDLRGVDLRGADLRNADLSFADLRGANLSQAWLDGADLSFVLATGVDFQLASLRHADLRLADLSQANFTTADLSDADLSSAVTTGTLIEGSEWAGVVCPNGSLLGDESRCGQSPALRLVESLVVDTRRP